MIKRIPVNWSTHIRQHVELYHASPAITDAFRMIGSIVMLAADVVVPPSNREQVNSFFERDHANYRWIRGQMRLRQRASIFVGGTAELVIVEVNWFGKRSETPAATLTTAFDDSGPVQTKHGPTQ